MARITDIITEAANHVSFCFGRMNPPHYGHEGVIKTVQATAKGGAWAIFVSKSHDNKKNPLPYEIKLKWILTLYPQTQGHLVEDPSIKTVLAAAAHLYNKGFRSATFVAGEDDMAQMRKLLEDYNGQEGKSHGFYAFEPLSFVESPRLTSATNARQAAADNNPEAFETATKVKSNITVDGKTLFQAVRQGMMLESVMESKQPDLTQAFADFLPVAMAELKLKKLPRIKLEKRVSKHDQPTFARYINDEHQIHLGVADRHPMDILRTLAHELVHFKQHLGKELDSNSGDTGSPAENEAHVKAGIIMRHFAKKHPGYFQDSAVSMDENFKDGRHPEDKGDAKRHGVPTKASVSTLRKVAKQGGRKGQLAHWMANMKAGKKKASEGKLLDKPTPTVAEIAEKYNVSKADVNNELIKGIKVEMEHTDKVEVAREIALDHLNEKLDYYTLLQKVEKSEGNMQAGNSVIGNRAVAVLPSDRWAVKVDENYEANLFEVSMSPGALNDFAKSEAAQSMMIGFEMELVMPDLPEENSYRGDPEPEEDMEMNQDFPRGRNWRQEVISWCTEGDEANSERDVERALEWMEEEFLEYLDEHFNDSVESDEDLQEKIKNEISDALSKAGKPNETDDIEHEFNHETDFYTDAYQLVKDDWHSENADDVWDNYLHRWRINDMEDFLLFINRNHPRLTLRYPYVNYNYPPDEESDQAEYLQEIANSLERTLQKVNSSFYVVVSEDYHSEDREENKFIIEPDGSISPRGREFISPAMPFAEGIAAMEAMFNWAKRQEYKTNQSTGFHMGISLPNHETQNIDHMKFVLMLGDEHVLQKFNRAKAHYAVSTLNTMRNEIAGGRKINQQEAAGYLRQMATGLQDLATKELNKLLVPRGHHTQSVNIKNNYMEIRSAGDNYLPRFDEVKLTLLRYLRTLEISANDQAYRREYAKKLSKFLTNTQMIRTVDPVTGRKSVAAKDSLDATVQQAFSEYFAALQRGEDGAAAIAKLTTVLNQYQGTKTSTLKTQLQSKRANADKNSTKVKYHGAQRVEFAATGSAYEVMDSIRDYVYQNELTHNRLRAMYLQAPDGQQLWNVNFEYNAVVQGGGTYQPRAERNYWCFAPDKPQAIAQAKKAWNINTDNPGDMWMAYQQSGDNETNLIIVMSAYERSDGSAPDDRANSSLAHTNPTITATPGTPRPAFSQPAEPDQNGWVDLPQEESGTYIITYQNPQGETHQTAYDADSANDAEQQFVRAHPFRYDVISVRLQTD